MRILRKDQTTAPAAYTVEERGDVTCVTIQKDLNFSDVVSIDFEYAHDLAKRGDEGYFVLPGSQKSESMLCRFTEKADAEYVMREYTMPIFGVKTKAGAFVAIVTGMAYSYTLVCGVKDSRYYLYPRFILNGEAPCEDIQVEYHRLPAADADYSGMAREYRRYQLERGACLPLRERAAKNPTLAYAKDAVLIRIRMGWKPVPATVLHQTLKNEPPMHVACTFATVERLMDKLYAAGVKKAELTLVGWNVKGHDGRWPSAFPVAEELGGEEGLRRVIEKAKTYGYLIDGHTNSTDAYEISPLWDENDLLVGRDGKHMPIGNWSGGAGRALCPACALKQAETILPQVAKMGFHGLHYVDVVNIVMPRVCYSKVHPVNIAQSIDCHRQLARLCHDRFGGYSSEGVFDFSARYLDYGLYVCFNEKKITPLCDALIPWWQLVYHGIIMSNPYAVTVNYPIKGTHAHLKLLECGGRPSMYLYSKFVEKKDGNWMGEDDLTCDNEADMDATVAHIAHAYAERETLSHLEMAYMEHHREIAPDVFEIAYSDGTVLTVDYGAETFKISPSV